MMQKISALILSDEYSTNEVLKLFVSEFDNINLIDCPAQPELILATLTEMQNKSIFLVDLSNNKQEKLDLILKVSQQCPNCKVLALSDNPTVDLIIRIMRAGAKEFVPIPILKNEFFENPYFAK